MSRRKAKPTTRQIKRMNSEIKRDDVRERVLKVSFNLLTDITTEHNEQGIPSNLLMFNNSMSVHESEIEIYAIDIIKDLNIQGFGSDEWIKRNMIETINKITNAIFIEALKREAEKIVNDAKEDSNIDSDGIEILKIINKESEGI